MSRFSSLRDFYVKSTLRRTLFVENLRQAWGGILIIVVLTVGSVYFVWDGLAAHQDILGAPEQRAISVVTSVADLPAGRGSFIPSGLVWLPLHGKTISVSTPLRDYPPLHAGQKVEVIYRVGKSGRTQVERLQPMSGQPRP